jgi:hypothetical protein
MCPSGPSKVTTMRIQPAVLASLLLSASPFCLLAQAPIPTTPAAAAAPAAATGALQPALDSIKAALATLKLDKWKGGTVRTEAAANAKSIQDDLDSTLPALLKTADSAPGVISQTLPLYRNVDALYDVLLRVYEAARISAPADQIAVLQTATSSVEKSRHTLADRMQDWAAAQEKQITQLQSSLKAQVVPACPAPPVPVPAPAAAAKPAVKKKKPAAATKAPTTTTPPAAPAKPQN